MWDFNLHALKENQWNKINQKFYGEAKKNRKMKISADILIPSDARC